MKKSKTILLLLLTLILFNLKTVQAADIIPKPKSYVTNGQTFYLSPNVKILYSGELKELAYYLGEKLSPATGWDFHVKEANSKDSEYISLLIDSSKISEKEGYLLSITDLSVEIVG